MLNTQTILLKLDHASQRACRKAVRQALPHVPSCLLAEAFAAAQGFKSHASLRDAHKKGVSFAIFDEDAFAAFLTDKGQALHSDPLRFPAEHRYIIEDSGIKHGSREPSTFERALKYVQTFCLDLSSEFQPRDYKYPSSRDIQKVINRLLPHQPRLTHGDILRACVVTKIPMSVVDDEAMIEIPDWPENVIFSVSRNEYVETIFQNESIEIPISEEQATDEMTSFTPLMRHLSLFKPKSNYGRTASIRLRPFREGYVLVAMDLEVVSLGKLHTFRNEPPHRTVVVKTLDEWRTFLNGCQLPVVIENATGSSAAYMHEHLASCEYIIQHTYGLSWFDYLSRPSRPKRIVIKPKAFNESGNAFEFFSKFTSPLIEKYGWRP